MYFINDMTRPGVFISNVSVACKLQSLHLDSMYRTVTTGYNCTSLQFCVKSFSDRKKNKYGFEVLSHLYKTYSTGLDLLQIDHSGTKEINLY